MKSFKILIIIGLLAGSGLFIFTRPVNNFQQFKKIKQSMKSDRPLGGQEINFIRDKATGSLVEQAQKKESKSEVLTVKVAEDINGDGQAENYILSGGILEIKQGDKLIWRSPADWWVDSYYLADANGDGEKEINLSVWKAGDFGPAKPFWVKQNDLSVRNHFFVMRLAGDKVIPLWQSSNLEVPNCGFIFSDVDGDSKQELIVIEGEYNDQYLCQGKYLALWRWNGWGFSNDWRSPAGRYGKLGSGQDGRGFTVLKD